MKLTIEGRELNLSANGRFLQKYCKVFEENLTITLYNALNKSDPYALAKILYCAIEGEERSFDEWLESFKSPLFIIPYMEKIQRFIVAETTPTVESKGDDDSKKKTEKTAN